MFVGTLSKIWYSICFTLLRLWHSHSQREYYVFPTNMIIMAVDADDRCRQSIYSCDSQPLQMGFSFALFLMLPLDMRFRMFDDILTAPSRLLALRRA